MQETLHRNNLCCFPILLARKIFFAATALFLQKFVKMQKVQMGKRATLKKGSWDSKVAQQVS
ncbi:hypothetical protein I79_009424 [Cricetulus griseus]|uniref:Uncharacterized protein n=1 Tax=Cricetulus griseus TaxID=10029 RepID=G3HFR0_CRIGR|nr:hypothetical protein I79_009424 [Cricetulus griseus]